MEFSEALPCFSKDNKMDVNNVSIQVVWSMVRWMALISIQHYSNISHLLYVPWIIKSTTAMQVLMVYRY